MLHLSMSIFVKRVLLAAVVLSIIPCTASADQNSTLEKSPLEYLIPFSDKGGINQPDEPRYDEQQARGALWRLAGDLFINSDSQLDKLEAELDRLRESRERTRGGLLKLWKAYGFTERISEHKYDYEKVGKFWFEVVDKWISRRPDSVSAKMVKARMLRNLSYAALSDPRVTKHDTPNKRFADKHLLEARKHLEEIKEAVAPHDPFWYSTMLEIMWLSGEPPDVYGPVVAEALERYPWCQDCLLNVARIVASNSSTPFADLEALALNAAEANRDFGGDSLYYARVYWLIVVNVVGYDYVPALHIDWKRMEQGIDQLIAKFPDVSNVQYFAAFACFSGRKELTEKLVMRIDVRPMLQAWGQIENMFRCRQWVESGSAPKTKPSKES